MHARLRCFPQLGNWPIEADAIASALALEDVADHTRAARPFSSTVRVYRANPCRECGRKCRINARPPYRCRPSPPCSGTPPRPSAVAGSRPGPQHSPFPSSHPISPHLTSPHLTSSRRIPPHHISAHLTTSHLTSPRVLLSGLQTCGSRPAERRLERGRDTVTSTSVLCSLVSQYNDERSAWVRRWRCCGRSRCAARHRPRRRSRCCQRQAAPPFPCAPYILHVF